VSPAGPERAPGLNNPPHPRRQAAFVFIFITLVLDTLAFGVLIPVTPKLVLEFTGGDMAEAAHWTGLFGLVWAAMQFGFSPLLGALSDRFGRRPIILLSNIGLGLDYFLMALAPGLGWLMAGRVVSGLTAASFSTATAYVADVTKPEERAAKFGLMGAAFGLGFVIGPALGGVLGGIDLRLPFWVAGGLSLANGVYGLFILPESLPKNLRAPLDLRKANPLGSLTLLHREPGLFGLAFSEFFAFVAHESLPNMFVLYATYRYQWTERDVGLSLAFVGVCSALVQAALTGPAVKALGARGAVVVGLLFGAAGFAAFGFAGSGLWFMAGIPFIALWGINGPALNALMTARVSPQAQGQLQGALASLRGVSGMIGPVLFTQVFAQAIAGVGPPGLVGPGAPYFLAAGLVMVAMGVAWVATRPRP
jgi:MFS transporter, DHA1 family, tetracycline resistance protein